MTEEEAKTKTCPIAAQRSSFDDNWDKGMCIGSKCMMWREDHSLAPKKQYPEKPLTDCDITTRLRNCLLAIDVTTIKDLSEVIKEIKNTANLGKVSLAEAVRLLDRYGVGDGRHGYCGLGGKP